jgi:tryptophanyl-tRNA synthetase
MTHNLKQWQKQMKVPPKKPVLLSGIQPTGNLMIGNYIGAIKHWVQLQETHDCLFILVDLHAITIRQEPAVLLRRSYDLAALYIACGIDPEKNTIFLQSHVPAHTQLLWILNCFVHMGELSRMTQFKDKAHRHGENINVGLFSYPVLMAADILLYQTDLVPVGDDQKQHLEFTRNIARRFNHLYGKVFNIPNPFIPDTGSRIMGLRHPLAKMSKSDDNPDNYIALLDSPDTVRKKIRQAVTDPGKEVRYSSSKPGISNLMNLYSTISGLSIESIQSQYAGKEYVSFKEDLAESIIEFLNPIQKRYRSVLLNRSELEIILKNGASEARERAESTLNKVYEAVGFVSF